MNNCKIIIIIFVYTAFLNTFTYSAFKNYGWSTRATGMGGVFTAISDDSSSIFYNPAGTSKLENPDVGIMYAKPYAGLENVSLGLMSLSYAHPLKNIGTFGLGITDYGNNLYKENMIMIEYSRKIYDKNKIKANNLSAGLNLKQLSHKYKWDADTIKRAEEYGDPVILAGSSKSTFTGDIGFLYNINSVSFGLSALNINQPDVGLYIEDKVPVELRLGSLFRFKNNTITGLDVSYRNQEWGETAEKLNIYIGGERWFSKNKFALRIGTNKQDASFGSSLNQKMGKLLLRLDYAFVWSLTIGDNFGTHRLSISLVSIPAPKKTSEIKKLQQTQQKDTNIITKKEEKLQPENIKLKFKKEEKVNINNASTHELMSIGFTQTQANAIIMQRMKKPFNHIDELLSRVKEIPAKKFLELKEKISVKYKL